MYYTCCCYFWIYICSLLCRFESSCWLTVELFDRDAIVFDESSYRAYPRKVEVTLTKARCRKWSTLKALTTLGRLCEWVFSIRCFLESMLCSVYFNTRDQLTLTNPRDAKACKKCSESMCFVSFHRIPFRRISNYGCIASRGMFRLYGYTQFEIWCLPIKFLVQITCT